VPGHRHAHRRTRRAALPQATTLDVGLAVHKASIAVAYVARAHAAEGTSLGPIGTRQGDLEPLIRKRPSTATHLVFVYEAGPCGDWRSRDLPHKGHVCWGVAPSLIPNPAGDRGTTARRDARPWARLRRAGALAPVDVPTVEDEAMRALSRAREEALGALKAAQFRLNACWRRHDLRSTGRAPWGPAPLRWRSDVVCPTPAQPLVFQADVRAVTAHPERRQRLAQELHDPVNAWRLHPVVEALQAWRGVPFTVAVTLVAERGDLTRFTNPRALMKV
jgi:transposase